MTEDRSRSDRIRLGQHGQMHGSDRDRAAVLRVSRMKNRTRVDCVRDIECIARRKHECDVRRGFCCCKEEGRTL